MAVALTALFLALGGVSYGLAVGSIGSREIKNNSVRSVDIRNNDVRSQDVRNGSLLATDFRAGQLPAGPRGITGPQGPPGERGVSNAASVSQYVGGPLPESPPALLGRLDLPAGAYVVFARVVISGSTGGSAYVATCELDVGGSKDTAVVRDEAPAGGGSIPVTLTLLRNLASAGSATLGCYDTASEAASWNDLQITAISVGNVAPSVATP
jgi:hypothetical protein